MAQGMVVAHAQDGKLAATGGSLTSPKIITALNDTNDNELLKVTATGSAVNELTLANAATGNNPILSATGGDSNVGITLTPKGTGAVKITSNYDAWVSLGTAPTTITALGNRSYTVLIPSIDYTDRLSPGMRLRMTRTVAAPTQCTDLESGSSQYYSKTSPAGMTFTDDFVVSAWIKLESYKENAIVSRWNATSGWGFRINASGQVILFGNNAGGSNNSYVLSYQSIPLNKWVHVAAQLDMSAFTATTTTSYIMIDGVDVPASVARGGTNPTALVQAGDLQVGADNGGNFFDGKIAQVAIYNAKVTQATILASMNQTLSGSETSLISAYSFNNSINDLSANANNLTANGSAVATNADTPFTQTETGITAGTLNFGIITAKAFSTNTTLTVQVPEGDTIPTTGGVSAVSYSVQDAPYGFPRNRGKWVLEVHNKNAVAQASPVQNTFYNIGSVRLNVPIGAWIGSYEVNLYCDVGATSVDASVTLSTGSSSESDIRMTARMFLNSSTSQVTWINRSREYDFSSATILYLNAVKNGGTLNNLMFYGATAGGTTVISLVPAYI